MELHSTYGLIPERVLAALFFSTYPCCGEMQEALKGVSSPPFDEKRVLMFLTPILPFSPHLGHPRPPVVDRPNGFP